MSEGRAGPSPSRRRPSITSAAAARTVESVRPSSRSASTSSSLFDSSDTSSNETPRASLRAGHGSGQPHSLRGQFLSRFIGNFRSSSSGGQPPSPSTSFNAGRPSLPRSLSSPSDVASPSVSTPFDAPTAPAMHPPSPGDTSFAKRLKPSFARRATTAGGGGVSSSPVTSPAHSPSMESLPRPSPGSPATLRGRERDPMDFAVPGGPSSPAWRSTATATTPDTDGGSAHRGPPIRRGSAVSQSTVRPDSGVRTPLEDWGAGLDPISEPTELQSAPVERPLEVITTLLPPTLLLLAQLGPSHLFSPSLSLGSLLEAATFNSTLGSSAASQSTAFSDQASISSMASSTSSFKLFNASDMSHACSHELHAPSTLPMPAVSAAAIWRLFRGFEWIGEIGLQAPAMIDNPSPNVEHEADVPSFDMVSLLQGVADILAADAAAKGVELVAAHEWKGAAPSPVSTPSADTTPPKEKKIAAETRELSIRGDERAWSVVCAWILHHIIASAAPGSSIAINFSAIETQPPTRHESPVGALPDLDPTPRAATWWNIGLDITVVPAVSMSSPLTAIAPPPEQPTPPFEGTVAKTLFKQLGIRMTDVLGDDGIRTWKLSALVASPPAKAPSTEPASSLLSRRRASLDANTGKEPTIAELDRFVETTLRAQKVALHSGENSVFAKHLTAYLAGWGMDVHHVPLEASVGGADTMWSKGKRETMAGEAAESVASAPTPEVPKTTSPPDGASVVPNDGSTQLIAIDDDHVTLRRLLKTARMASPFPSSLIAKRPQLGARRARSSPHVRQLQHLPAVNSNTVIIHFASLTHYKAIKDVVQEMLASTKQPNLPEVLVIPKPAGPRRIVTAMWTALKHPSIDPSLPPIATSPTSPGGSYWSPRLSPALAKEQQTEYDFGMHDAASIKESSYAKPRTPPAHLATKPRTPPAQFSSAVPAPAHPPSPLGKISDDQVSYFAGVAETLEGSSPSEGMVIQSPDGRPAIFFQPSSKNTRQDRSRQSLRNAERRGSTESARHSTSDSSSARPPLATPHDIGLGHSRRQSSSGSSAQSPGENVMVGTPALTLDSFISAAAKSRSPVEEQAPELSQPEASSLSRHSSSASRSAGTSPRVGAASASAYAARRMTTSGSMGTPPSASAPASPNIAAQSIGGGRQREASVPTPPPPLAMRRSTISVKNRRKSSRRTSLATVPPINVLIVEDNPINQTILSMFMKKKGIKYAVAKDGEEAVQKWKNGSFHLVLMDIQLPVKDGIEATIEIRDLERQNNVGTFVMTPTPSDAGSPLSTSAQSSAPSTPTTAINTPSTSPLTMPVIIVALTASSLQADRVKALAAGCNDFLTKPVSLPWLQQKLLEWGSMAYLSGFSSPRSDTIPPASDKTASSPRSRSFRKHVTAGTSARAEQVSAHLHIEPKLNGRTGPRSESPAGDGSSSSARSSSPARAGAAAAIALKKERAQRRAAAAAAAVAASRSSPSATPPNEPAIAPPAASQEVNPSFNIIAPTPESTPHTGAPPGVKQTADAGADQPDKETTARPSNIGITGQRSDAVAVTSPSSPGSSFPANLDVVDEKLENVASQRGQQQQQQSGRPGPSPLAREQSLSDLSLDHVVAEGARLAGASRGRSSSSGDSFGQVMSNPYGERQ
ncbi:Two-component response regulator SSK1p [Microbotryomycetes sp. JL201]|nr:Two-component response regulator SSK1p [Microbotryomycetes sp. JL201]